MSAASDAELASDAQQLEGNTARDVDNDNLLEPDALRHLSRSPHPYAFRRASSTELTIHSFPDRNTSTASPSPTESANEARSSTQKARNGSLIPSLNRICTNGSSAALKSPSESGTEADDESYGYGFVRALPAPPIRPNKGLRRSLDFGKTDAARRSSEDVRVAASPWLTPSQLLEEDARARHDGDYFTRPRDTWRRGSAKSSKSADSADADEETRAAKERIRRKRRAELVRRLVETVLLALVASTVITQQTVRDMAILWQRGTYLNIIIEANTELSQSW